MECTFASLTKFLRAKPFILGVGLEKCGTSSLHDYFSLAQNVSVPWPKELEFFSSHYSKGLDWYLAHFDLRKDILFDFTPTYHWKGADLERIERTLSNKVVLIMLRDPIARAYSAFIHRAYWFFEAALSAGKARDYDRTFHDVVNLGSDYVLPSYIETISRVESVFGASKVVIIPLENFIADPKPFVHLLEERLGHSIALPQDAVFPRSNSLAVPQFFRGRDILEHNPTVKGLITEPDDVYFCRGGMPRRIASGDQCEFLKGLEAKWLVPFSSSDVAAAFAKYYRSETLEIERRTGLELQGWGKSVDLRPKTVPPLSESATEANDDVAVWYARKMYHSGRRQEAIQFVNLAIKRDRGVPQYHRLLAWMHLENGEPTKADEHALIAISQAPANAEYLIFRRYVLNRIEIAASLARNPVSESTS
jgi:hypothetical protein